MDEQNIVMNISPDFEGILRARPNRFLGVVDIPPDLVGEKVHIHDPGRLEELLYPGNQVLLKKASGTKRKTGWDLIAGWAGSDWILINSAYHRSIARWYLTNGSDPLFEDVTSILPEKTFGESRLDFLVEKGDSRIWVEVKGCTLTRDGMALFPDAPTKRGQKHVKELINVIKGGDKAAMLVLVLGPPAKCFASNVAIDPEFADLLNKALRAGVQVIPVSFRFDGTRLYYMGKLPLCMGNGHKDAGHKDAGNKGRT